MNMKRFLMEQRKKRLEKKEPPKEKEFRSDKPHKFFMWREPGGKLGIKLTQTKGEFNSKKFEEVLEESRYDETAPPVVLSEEEFKKLEKFLTPMPHNIIIRKGSIN